MVEYFWNEVFNKHNTAVIDEMTAPNYIQHNPGFQDGRQAFEDGIDQAFGDLAVSRLACTFFKPEQWTPFTHLDHLKYPNLEVLMGLV